MDPTDPRPTPKTFAQTLEEALRALPAPPSGTLAAKGALALAAVGLLPGCEPAAPATGPGSLEQDPSAVIAYGQQHWYQREGKRDVTKQQVRYYGEYWRDFSNCNSRYGCMSITVFIKLLVKPNPAADISYKKIGVVYREVGKSDPITSVGSYFSRRGDGWEEWHVPVKSTSFQGAFTFGAWYEDGASNLHYDDNNGELYALTWKEPYNDYTTLSTDYAGSNARFTASGVSGTLSFTVEDLDYDKELTLTYSTDGGSTWTTLPMGTAGDKNKVYWSADLSTDFERWKIDLDLPGSFPSFQYKVIYRHGITSGATPVEFTLGNVGGISMPKM